MIRFERGQLLFLRPNAPTIGVHWSLPLGLAILSRFTFDPWFCIGYIGLILVHEFGHASLVKAFGLDVEEIVLHGLGGECRYSGAVTQHKRSIIAWGGVAAQTLLLALVLAISMVVPPEGSWNQLFLTLTQTNAILLAINLIPLPGFDGFHAWKLVFGRAKAKRPAKKRAQHAPSVPASSPGPASSKDGAGNVLRFPSERVIRVVEEPGKALRDVNAQILEITEKVNHEHSSGSNND